MEIKLEWNWNEMCGPDGLQPWNNKVEDLGICFQQLFLDIPVLFFLGITSAFYVGYRREWMIRGKLQENVIIIRSIVALCLCFVPVVHLYVLLTTKNGLLYPVTYLLAGTETITWLMHFFCLLNLRKCLGLSPRGPVLLLVWWTSCVVLTVVQLRSLILTNQNYVYTLCVLTLHFFYCLTLIPSEGSCSRTFYSPNLLGSQYSRFSEYSPLLQHPDENVLGTALQGVTICSKLMFFWVEPLFQIGLQKKLKVADDLFDLPTKYRCTYLGHRIDRALIGNVDKFPEERVVEPFMRPVSISTYGSTSTSTPSTSTPLSLRTPSRRHRVTLLRALHSCFALQFYAIGLLKFASDTAGFAGPIILNKVVSYVEDDTIDVQLGYVYAFALLATTAISAFCNSHFQMQMALVGIKMRSAIISTILRKTMSVTSTELNNSFSVGEITNFMSTDTDRIVNACPSFHAVWSIPLQMFVSLYLLYMQVGIAFLAGVAFSIVLIPINKVVANKIAAISTKLMEEKDKRVSLMSDVLKGIRTIKIHVWEDFFLGRINAVRRNELKHLKARKYLDAICVVFWATTPVLVSTLTLSTYYLLGNQLKASTAFTAVALMNMLIAPLNAFPWVLNGIMEAWVSMKRVQKLLQLNDLNTEQFYDCIDQNKDDEMALILKNATFEWPDTSIVPVKIDKKRKNKNKGKSSKRISKDINNEQEPKMNKTSVFCLRNLNLEVRNGQLVGVIGKISSGKSSLLQSFIGEMLKKEGSIHITSNMNGFGYVSQTTWLQRGTIRDNILFGKTYDDAKYREVIEACALTDDIQILGSQCSVGQGGNTLSGGQRARIALARAVYQDKDVYLLDDILSAVDAKVAHHIFRNCICNLLKNKTRILVTHSLQFLEQANLVVLMEDGQIKKQGQPSAVLDDIVDLIHSDNESESEDIPAKKDQIISDQLIEEDDSLIKDEANSEEEHLSTGTIDWWVVTMYLRSIGITLFICILMSLTLMQLSQNVTFLWLSFWVNSENPKNSTNFTLSRDNMAFTEGTSPISTVLPDTVQNSSTGKLNVRESSNSMVPFLSVYIGMAASNVLFTTLRAFLFAYGGILAASRIHRMLLKSVIVGRMKFFDVTPTGRILNRFSSDTYTVDDSLPFILNILLAQVFGLIGSLIITLYGLPWVCLVLIPLLPIYHWMLHRYRMTSRELKRLHSITLSPIYSHFNETLEGLTVIRALKANSRVISNGEELVELSQRANLSASAAAAWLTLRLQVTGVAVVAGAALVAVAERHFQVANAGLVGLAISYALTVTSLLSGVMNAFPETEREMIAVERVGEYIREVEPEQSVAVIWEMPLYGWPAQGVVKFDEVVMKYHENSPPALRGVSFCTRPGEKVGIVGRTGAGKSSIVAALLRLAEIHSGSIVIDSVDIRNLSLSALRSRLAVIPQEPFIFNGTIRENLDPLREYSDDEIWIALEKCGAHGFLESRGGLHGAAENIGRGFSQLLCLTRALLHNAKVICIDEATANIDQDTDKMIQDTIRNSFRSNTVLTIAHRISTILDSDRVLVMGEGKVLEFDSPEVLLQDTNSYFYELVNMSSIGYR